jgi:hypothetical protein
LKAERHHLYGIHFRVKVDAHSLIEMVNKPDLMPSAPGNHWLAFIQLFDFEITHVPAERHKGPDGLSRRRKADDDSTDSNSEMDADNENKFARSTGCLIEINELTLECIDWEYDLEVEKKLLSTRLNQPLGECLAMEISWDLTHKLAMVGDNHLLFEGRRAQIDEIDDTQSSPRQLREDANDTQSSPEQLRKGTKNTQSHERQLHTRNIHEIDDTQSSPRQLREDANEDNDIPHTHAKMDNNSVEFWDQVLSFLINLKLPSDPDKA